MDRVSNALVDLKYTISIPPAKVREICGEDDGTDEWFSKAHKLIEERVLDNHYDILGEYGQDDPEIEVTM